MTNDQLIAAWKRKLPGVDPTDRELTAFALGVEVAEASSERRAITFGDLMDNKMNRTEAQEFFHAHSEWLANSWGMTPEGREYKCRFDRAVEAIMEPEAPCQIVRAAAAMADHKPPSDTKAWRDGVR